MNESRTSPGTPLRPSEGEAWPRPGVRRGTLALSAWALRGWGFLVGALEDIGATPECDRAAERLARWHDRQDWPVRPLRVGVAEAGALAEAMACMRPVCETEWFLAARTLGDEEQARALLDAVVWEDPGGGVRVRTTEHAGREAAWYDLATPRPLSFSTVFPARLDVRQVTIESVSMSEVETLHALVECAALLSRHEARLALRDRLGGRRPVCPARRRGGGSRVEPFHPRCDRTNAVLQRLALQLQRVRRGDVPTALQRCAARLVSAWSATWEGIDESTRRQAAEDAARVAGDEVEVLLRCASVRLDQMDDDNGLEMLLAACRLAHGHGQVLGDQVSFLLSELETGEPSPRTTARVAVGAALAVATVPPERARFLREDLAEDLRRARALVGREQDARFIYEVVTRIERELAADAHPARPQLAA